MKKYKRLVFIVAVVLGVSALFTFSSCDKKSEIYTVTYYDSDATTVLKKEKIKKGENAENWTPEKKDMTFLGWFATPALKREFSFEEKIVADTSLFASWKSSVFKKDEREWLIAGQSSYKGSLLNSSDWGRIKGEEREKFTFKRTDENKNEFTLTLDMYVGDQFQIADVDADNSYAWTFQRGYGYLKSKDVDDFIKSAGNIYSEDLTKANIEIIKDGNYTLTLITDVDNPSLDELNIKRNGEPGTILQKTYAPSIAGSVTGGNAIADKKDFGDFGFNETVKDSKIYELTISLNKGDFFAVLLYENSWDDVLRTSSIEAGESDACYDTENKSNITMLQSAKYKITLRLNEAQGVIVIKNVGTFERSKGDNEIKFTDGKETVFVRQGARVPNPKEPEGQTGKIFVGWYTDLKNNVPMNFNAPFDKTGQIITCEPKFLSSSDKDTRTVYIKGDLSGWADKEEYKMNSDGVHTYTFDLSVENTVQFMFTFYEGTNDTGVTANGVWVDYNNTAAEVSGLANITISSGGTYRITLDSFHKKVTIVKL